MIRIILAFCLILTPLAAQYEYTGDAIGDNTWTNPENWKLPGQDPAPDFPDNGATALLAVSSVQLTQPIRLGALDINTGAGRTTDLNGNTLEVTGTFTSGGADLANGTFSSPTFQLNSSLRLFNISATTTTINAFASVALLDSSSLTFDGTATLHGNFGFSAGTGTNLLENQGGTLTKTGGTGFSNVAADYTQSGAASTEVHTGNLQFDGTTMINGGTLVSESRMLFTGPTTFSSPQVALIDDGRVETFNVLTLPGTLTSTHSGTGSIPGISARNGFVGGTLDCDVAAPFVMTGGSSSPTIPTTNTGAFFWDAGTLHDFNNSANTRGEFVLNNYFAASGGQTLAGHFVNSGYVLQETPGQLNLDTDALFENQAGATYENTGGNIGSVTGATGHQFLNNGTFLRPEQAGAGTITISAPFSSTGEVIVRDNGLRIQGPGNLSGTLRSDRSTRPDALLEIGGAGQVIGLNGTVFDVLGDGLIEFEGGEFLLSGLLESTEGDGTVHVRSGSVDLVVASGFPATLNFNDFVPLRIGSDNNTPEILLADTLTNTGRIDLFLARLQGAAPMKNTGTIFIDQILDIGSTSGGGQLINNGLIDFPTLTGNRIRLNPGGQLINNEPGGTDANLTGGTILLGNGDQIDSSFVASSVQVINKGDILISEGGRRIDCRRVRTGWCQYTLRGSQSWDAQLFPRRPPSLG